jgi:hypothetical protein
MNICPCQFSGEQCCVTSDEGYICNLPKAHEGNHVACGGSEHALAIWPQSKAEENAAVMAEVNPYPNGRFTS